MRTIYLVIARDYDGLTIRSAHISKERAEEIISKLKTLSFNYSYEIEETELEEN